MKTEEISEKERNWISVPDFLEMSKKIFFSQLVDFLKPFIEYCSEKFMETSKKIYFVGWPCMLDFIYFINEIDSLAMSVWVWPPLSKTW